MKINSKKLLLLSGFAFLGVMACKEDGKKDTAQVEKVPRDRSDKHGYNS